MDEFNDNPGPGAYCTRDRYTKHAAPIYSMGQKFRSGAHVDQPGPGAYDPKLGGNGPSYTLPARFRSRSRDQYPGPGAYGPEFSYTKQCPPSYSIASKLLANDGEKNPGPGSYEVRGRLGAGPAYSLAARTPRNSKSSTPGPGAYNAAARSNAPAYSIAVHPRTAPRIVCLCQCTHQRTMSGFPSATLFLELDGGALGGEVE